jgi:hypothetical protein
MSGGIPYPMLTEIYDLFLRLDLVVVIRLGMVSVARDRLIHIYFRRCRVFMTFYDPCIHISSKINDCEDTAISREICMGNRPLVRCRGSTKLSFRKVAAIETVQLLYLAQSTGRIA